MYRSVSPMDPAALPTPIGDVAADVREFTDSTAVVGTTYYYRVSAYKGSDEVVGDEITILAEDLYLGPGSTTFVGGDYGTTGFLGEVDTTTLIDGDTLASDIGLTEGTSKNPTEPWLKFAIDGKILFVAKKTYRYSVTWDAINAANAVYGDKIITIGGYAFKLRLLTGAESDPSSLTRNTADPAGSEVSEWNKLIYKVHVDVPSSQSGANWVNYTNTDLDVGGTSSGTATWCQEHHTYASNYAVFRGYNGMSMFNSTGSNAFAAAYGWRPVLELLPKDYVFPVTNTTGVYFGYNQPVITNGTSEQQFASDIQPVKSSSTGYYSYNKPIITNAEQTQA